MLLWSAPVFFIPSFSPLLKQEKQPRQSVSLFPQSNGPPAIQRFACNHPACIIILLPCQKPRTVEMKSTSSRRYFLFEAASPATCYICLSFLFFSRLALPYFPVGVSDLTKTTNSRIIIILLHSNKTQARYGTGTQVRELNMNPSATPLVGDDRSNSITIIFIALLFNVTISAIRCKRETGTGTGNFDLVGSPQDIKKWRIRSCGWCRPGGRFCQIFVTITFTLGLTNTQGTTQTNERLK